MLRFFAKTVLKKSNSYKFSGFHLCFSSHERFWKLTWCQNDAVFFGVGCVTADSGELSSQLLSCCKYWLIESVLDNSIRNWHLLVRITSPWESVLISCRQRAVYAWKHGGFIYLVYGVCLPSVEYRMLPSAILVM